MTIPQQPPSFEQPDNQANPVVQPQTRQVQLQVKQKRPVVVYTIIGITVFVWLLQMASVFLLGGDLPAALLDKSNPDIQAGQMWRLITPVLLHSTSFSFILHIVFNMYALNAIGPMLEQFYGHRRFLALYIVTGVAGNLLSFIFSAYPSLGASTSIFGLIAAQLVFVYINRQMFGTRARSILTNIGVLIVINLAFGLVPGIDIWGHVGGLVGGLVFAFLAGPLMKVEQQGTEYQLVNTRTSMRFWGTFAFETALLFFIATLVIFLRR
jgi:rhomboid protease GluP